MAAGHSLGGKAAMATALRYPEIVSRLMVVDMAPGNISSNLGSAHQVKRP